MAVRPPSNDSSEPETIEFGIAALNARIDDADLTFPATEAEILSALESARIPYDAAGHEMDLSEAFDRVSQTEFETETELLDVLHPVFERRRSQAGPGFVERLRNLLPF